MHVWRRLVWWKGLFWTAVGCGAGATYAAYRPVPAAPAGAVRVPVERVAVGLAADDGSADGMTDPVLYPSRDGVRLLTFDWHDDGHVAPAYLYATEPFLTEAQLRPAVKAGERLVQSRSGFGPGPYVGRLKAAADRAVAAIAKQPNHGYATFADLARQLPHPPVIARAWWAEPRWRQQVPMAAGAVVFGLAGLLLTRRTVAEVEAADLLRRPPPAAAPAAPPVDLTKVAELDALLQAKLEAGVDPSVPAAEPSPSAVAGPGVPVRLHAEAVEPAPAEPEEEKTYAGTYYPTVRPGQPRGFSLVELLVSIGIVGVLVALLLPALVGARDSADTIACAANLHAIGQGLTIYLGANQNTFPPAYLYIGHSLVNGVQTPTDPSAGYVHWSSYLYGSGSVPAKAFQCPALRQGGLPPTNTPPGNRDPGQVCPSQTVVDEQAPRLAYSVNEVLCPRNKFVKPAFFGSRVYRFVKANEVARSAETILATEMIDDDAAVSYDDLSTGWVMSHRPICGYFGVDGTLDMFKVPVGVGFRGTTAADLDPDPTSAGTSSHSRLDLVGRNHGRKVGYPDRRRSNFLYVDGHVRTQTVYDTVSPSFQWGDRFYSLTPNGDQVYP